MATSRKAFGAASVLAIAAIVAGTAFATWPRPLTWYWQARLGAASPRARVAIVRDLLQAGDDRSRDLLLRLFAADVTATAVPCGEGCVRVTFTVVNRSGESRYFTNPESAFDLPGDPRLVHHERLAPGGASCSLTTSGPTPRSRSFSSSASRISTIARGSCRAMKKSALAWLPRTRASSSSR